MTRMKLREPAASLWKKHHEAVRRISSAPGGESRLLMGGGSVLAAEWDHRVSMDIDLLVPEREGLQDTKQGGRVDLAAATGGKLVKELPNQISVEVDEGRIDVAAMPPDLPGLEREAEIDGRRELVLANAQILRGKLDQVARRTSAERAAVSTRYSKASFVPTHAPKTRTASTAAATSGCGSAGMCRTTSCWRPSASPGGLPARCSMATAHFMTAPIR